MGKRLRSRLTFASVCQKDLKYKAITRRTPRPKVETELEQCILRIGEREIGKLRVDIAHLEGRIELERQKRRTQGAELLGKLHEERSRVLAFLIQAPTFVGRALVTPYSDLMRGQLLLPAPGSNGVAVGESSVVIPSASDATGPSQSTSTLTSRVYGLLPSWLQVIVDVCTSQLRKLTPLGTAILLIFILSGAFVYARHSVSELDGMYQRVLKDRDERSKEVDALKKDLEAMPKIRDEVERLKIAEAGVKGYQQTIADLQKQIKSLQSDHKQELSRMNDDHKAVIVEYQKGLDEAARNNLAVLNTQLTEAKTKIEELTNLANEKTIELARFEKVEQQLSDANKTLESKTTQLSDLQDRFNKVDRSNDYFKSLSKGVLTLVDQGLGRCKKEDLYYHQNDFRKKCNVLIDAAPEVFREVGINKYYVSR